jgi:hypothetical protein
LAGGGGDNSEAEKGGETTFDAAHDERVRSERYAVKGSLAVRERTTVAGFDPVQTWW